MTFDKRRLSTACCHFPPPALQFGRNHKMSRLVSKLKLGYYPLPVQEARHIRALLVASAPYSAVDPCAGDGTALLEITKNTEARLAAIELDADRAAAAAHKGLTTVH